MKMLPVSTVTAAIQAAWMVVSMPTSSIYAFTFQQKQNMPVPGRQLFGFRSMDKSRIRQLASLTKGASSSALFSEEYRHPFGQQASGFAASTTDMLDPKNPNYDTDASQTDTSAYTAGSASPPEGNVVEKQYQEGEEESTKTTEPLAGKIFQIEEMEDADSCASAITLNPDGTVHFGLTDGPLPSDAVGHWSQVTTSEGQESKFKMVLKRIYDAGNGKQASTDMGEFSFTVEHTYEGYVNKIGARLGASGVIFNYDDLLGGQQEVGYFSMIDTDGGNELQLGQKMTS